MMYKLFKPGMILHGYCSGCFGRDNYEDKICSLVKAKYAVFEYVEGERQGQAIVLNYSEGLENLVKDWEID